MMSKALLFGLIVATAWAFPQDDDYDDYVYHEEELDYGELPEFSFSSQQLVVEEGEKITIPCQTVNPSEYVLIVKKDATEDEKEQIIFVGDVKVMRSRRFNLADRQLEISNVRRSDAGTYICSYQTQSGPIQMTHEVDVHYAPTVEAVSPAEQRVNKGASVHLECQAEGNPTPTISWSRKDGRLPSGAQKEEGLSLTLADVDRHVEGTYECTAENGVGSPASATMSVMVEYLPEIITEKAIIRSGEGDTVELVCIVHARPAPIVSWSKDGQAVDLETHTESKEGGHRHALMISGVTEEDFGEYLCTASNQLGQVESSIHMTGLPKPAHFTSDPNGGEESSYTLTWETESYYPIESYQLKYRKAKANDSTEEPGDWMDGTFDAEDVETNGLMHTMKHKIDDLEPATDYEAMVQIKNQFKWSENQLFSFSTRKVSPTTPTTTSTTTPTTPPTTTFEEIGGPTSGSVQEVTGQQSTYSGSSSAGVSILLMIGAMMLLRT